MPRIDRQIAEALHFHFMDVISPVPGTTKGVFFPFSDFVTAFNESYKDKGIQLVTTFKETIQEEGGQAEIDLPGIGFYCYFARYIDADPTLEKNSVIVAFTVQDPQNPTELLLLNNSMYDFGEPCPRKCPTNNLP